ncbi:MAG: Gfo/Idh/MocA family protein [Vicinamibacterales bacterium]
MADSTDRPDIAGVGRREFLALGALPAAATFAGAASQTAPGGAVRIGLIGAGENVRDVMIPAFRRIPECQLVAVANTSLASSQRVATQFGIPKAYPHWKALLDDRDVDAVCIGTWPYMHHTLTLAALGAGKHVLCQARMANNAREAREMLAASLRHPDLVCQLVPTSTSYRVDNLLRKLLAEGYVGDLLSVEIQRLGRSFAATAGELDWRHSQEFSGLNVMTLGSTYESVMRWLGRGTRVMAMATIHVPYRRAADGQRVAALLPDHVDVLYELSSGAQVHMRFSETTGLSSGNQTWIHGAEGTLHVDDRQTVRGGRRGDTELAEIPNPPEGQAVSRVEAEFIRAIRGLEPVTMNTFEIGVHYMEWTEAVHRSATTGQAVPLPLLAV